MRLILKMILAFGLIMVGSVSFAQNINDFRTVQSGSWSNQAIWERYDGSGWVAATFLPSDAYNIITIHNGHTIAVDVNIKIDQTTIKPGGQVDVVSGKNLIIENGAGIDMTVSGLLKNAGTIATTGTLAFSDGGLYQHNYTTSGGLVPTATWDTNSTCEIIGYTTYEHNVFLNQDFGNFTWNCTSQYGTSLISANGTLKTIKGNLKVISGKFYLSKSNNAPTMITVGRNLEISGGTLIMCTGGNLGIDLSGDFIMAGGTLTESGTGAGTINFIENALFNKTGGTISKTINFNVASGATLDIVNQPITGLGAFTLNPGAGLIIRDANGITSSGTSGTPETLGAVQTGIRTFDPGANYTYQGSVPQLTGNGLPDFVNNFMIDNAAGVTLTKDVTITSKHLKIAKTGAVISAFSADTSIDTNLLPQEISRKWTISGSLMGTDTKSVTFYWDGVDDDHYNWGNNVPTVYNETTGTSYDPIDYNVSSDQRWITVDLPSFDGATYTIRRVDENTLPIELSSFIATLYAFNQVKIQWVTQSETNVSGFRIYRNTENLLETAHMLDLFIPATNTSQMQVYLATDKEIQKEGTYYYWLENVGYNGESDFHGPIHINVILANAPSLEVPLIQGINNTYPNPFNPIINISCAMLKSGQVTVQVFNARGQIVKTLFNGAKDKGNFLLQWDGTDKLDSKLPTGVYLIRMDSDSGKSLRKVVLSE